MPETWIIYVCAIASIILALCNDAAWRRKYESLHDLAQDMNRSWGAMCLRHNAEWASKCRRLEQVNNQLREQLRKEGEA